MKKQFNSEDGKMTWGLDAWYEKTIFVLGWIGLIFWALAFIGAFFAEYQYQSNGVVEPDYSSSENY